MRKVIVTEWFWIASIFSSVALPLTGSALLQGGYRLTDNSVVLPSPPKISNFIINFGVTDRDQVDQPSISHTEKPVKAPIDWKLIGLLQGPVSSAIIMSSDRQMIFEMNQLLDGFRLVAVLNRSAIFRVESNGSEFQIEMMDGDSFSQSSAAQVEMLPPPKTTDDINRIFKRTLAEFKFDSRVPLKQQALRILNAPGVFESFKAMPAETLRFGGLQLLQRGQNASLAILSNSDLLQLGFRQGDRIISVNALPVDALFLMSKRELMEQLGRDDVKVELVRDQKKITVEMML